MAKSTAPGKKPVVTQAANAHHTEARLQAIRLEMAEHQLDVYWIPSSDEHLNEYLPDAHKRREWATGFSGSAGDCLVMCDEAWAYVDSRYYEQADYEVDARCVTASKVGLDAHPTLRQTLLNFAQKMVEARGKNGVCRVGFDPATLGLDQYQELEKLSTKVQIEWVPIAANLVDAAVKKLAKTMPSVLVCSEYAHPIFELPVTVTGETVASKLERVRTMMVHHGVEVLPVVKLDQVAWLFNLRGQDIPYNPVFLSYAVVTPSEALLFTDAKRLTPEAKQQLKGLVSVQPYESFASNFVSVIQKAKDPKSLDSAPVLVGLDPRHVTVATQQGVKTAGGQVVSLEHPLQILKAIKNPTELDGMRRANLKASRGKIRALFWLHQQTLGLKRRGYASVSEETFRQAIEGFYAEEPDYVGLSFNTIAGTGPNSSIVHYGTPNPEAYLREGDLFLIDSGVQFGHGTTDDTRTVVVGHPTPTQRHRYTAVLKAHIDCARQKYPKGTEGIRLDGITRAALWNEGLDFGHGTGHGVGAFLNVHEGPNGIHRMAKEPFQPGMVTSIEPGYYEPGWGGIRLENLYATIELPAGTSADGRPWYGFESLTYVPFDKKLIIVSSLSREQLQWLKRYYAAIVRKMTPLLNKQELRWLKQVCTL